MSNVRGSEKPYASHDYRFIAATALIKKQKYRNGTIYADTREKWYWRYIDISVSSRDEDCRLLDAFSGRVALVSYVYSFWLL